MPGVAAWIGEAIEELVGLDGKVPRTIRALAWLPGDLTIHWSQGRRALFVRPVRLYFAAAVLFFFVWPTTGFGSGLEDFIQGFADAGGVSPAKSSTATVQLGAQIVTESLPGLLIIFFVPFFAALLWGFNRSAGAFAKHLVMAVHLHTAFFAAIVVTAPINLILGERWERVGEPVLFLVLFAFLCTSIARVYDLVAWRAAAQGLVLVSVYSVVVASAVVGLLLVVL